MHSSLILNCTKADTQAQCIKTLLHHRMERRGGAVRGVKVGGKKGTHARKELAHILVVMEEGS
jgi:hypothetical protein